MEIRCTPAEWNCQHIILSRVGISRWRGQLTKSFLGFRQELWWEPNILFSYFHAQIFSKGTFERLTSFYLSCKSLRWPWTRSPAIVCSQESRPLQNETLLQAQQTQATRAFRKSSSWKKSSLKSSTNLNKNIKINIHVSTNTFINFNINANKNLFDCITLKWFFLGIFSM